MFSNSAMAKEDLRYISYQRDKIQVNYIRHTDLPRNDRIFDVEELKRVLNLFARNPFRLKSLLVWVQDLTVPLLLLLAGRLPGLHSLVLLFETCSVDIDYSGYQVSISPFF